MPTPTASPAVSSTVGLKNLVIAPLTADTESDHTYGDLQLVVGAIEASITPDNTDPDIQYADDIEFSVLYPDPELTFKTKMADVPLAIQEMIFGNVIDENGVLIRNANDTPSYFAVGFKSEKSNHKYRYVWLYKVRAKPVTESYRTTLGGSTYTASSFTTGLLSMAGSNMLTVSVTDSRGRTATTTRTITVLAYAPPTLSLFMAERCNSTGTAPQTDGNRVRISATAGASSAGGKNTMSCTVFYKLSSASTWTQATTIAHSNFAIASTNLLLPQTYDPLSSFDFMLRVTDYFLPPVEQSVSIGTKQVMMDFYRNGTGIAFGKVAETAGAVEFGWPLMLVAPLTIAQGGTGATSATAALAALGAAAASHSHALAACTGILAVAAGDTGATDAATARSNLGAAPSSHNHAASAITSGTLAAGLLPYKFTFGKVSISGSVGATINYSGAGFTSVPAVSATYSTTESNWSGDYGSLKVYGKTMTQASIIIGGSFSTLRDVDWIAIGT